MMEYSAGFTSEGWFQNEINIVLPLKIAGLSRSEILERIIEHNSFQLRSESSIKKRFQMVYRRSETFNLELSKLYIDGSRLDQKALLLYSYLKCYRLPYEFFNEVILYNYHNNKPSIQIIDVEFFIERKEGQSGKVAGFRPETKKRLKSSIVMFFRESGMLQEEKADTFLINPLHISKNLKNYAKDYDPLLYLLSELR
ncbi:DUF1819 family protein [Bacillus sp. ISL-47]|uniref:DUF1819 family protein n=1 Tax=Bacillus sp. ISL-47 TaxID=2819130 RepID=UPI001BEA7C6D|nr:DUF1819 family protein [Bacillus sp. ISL-47]MBT2687279.1 DUF1819 family protein [Bacillus sp. ISL-47]MBT2706651.1 DUF1819 family protein [Pseudomonas sp. ISL-84]